MKKYKVFSVQVQSQVVEVPDSVPENERKQWASDKAFEIGTWTPAADVSTMTVDRTSYPEGFEPDELDWKLYG